IRARVTAAKADLRTVGIAMETYFLDFDMYPPDHDPSTLTVGENGLFYLTSPLQYLTELPEDLFNTGSSGLNDAGDEVRWYEMGSTGVPWVIAQIAKPNVNAYAMYSTGPDGNEDFSDNDNWPLGTSPPCPNGMGYLTYSPTNGTKSVGDILQLGGEVTAGWYCVDRWKEVMGRDPRRR
ncbi:MAG: hypothetical protein KC994_22105, partial [Candidatus Omnitrophica bacterium]|nr:hypothetical protein [Candidatus Omnitrophota bacterium]